MSTNLGVQHGTNLFGERDKANDPQRDLELRVLVRPLDCRAERSSNVEEMNMPVPPLAQKFRADDLDRKAKVSAARATAIACASVLGAYCLGAWLGYLTGKAQTSAKTALEESHSYGAGFIEGYDSCRDDITDIKLREKIDAAL